MRIPIIAVTLVLFLPGCSQTSSPSPDRPADSAAAPLAGWYSAGRFQPCGRGALDVSNPGDLDRALRDKGFAEGDPVYVQIAGTERAGGFKLSRIVQVGSPAPVRDCPMTGTTTP